jgi:hypothetical protein
VPALAPARAARRVSIRSRSCRANAHAYVNAGFAATLSPAGVLVASPTRLLGRVGSTELASTAFRVGLVVNLLYKFLLACAPALLPRVASAAVPYVRSVSTGSATYTTNSGMYPVSAPLPKDTALVQATGQAIFCDDMPPTPKQLYAAFVLASGLLVLLAGLRVPPGLPGVVRRVLIAR